MLAPSYSEALLMEPAMSRNDAPEQRQENWQAREETDMVPSYSEALLYERAEQYDRQNAIVSNVAAECASNTATSCNMDDPRRMLPLMPCECHCPCPCHGNTNDYEMRMDERSYIDIATSREHLPTNTDVGDTFESELATLRTTADGRLHPPVNVAPRSMDNLQADASPSRCSSCGRISASTQTINTDVLPRIARNKSSEGSQTLTADFISGMMSERDHGAIPRDISEPNLRSRSELASTFPKGNVRSLENILENEEELLGIGRAGFANVNMNLPYERPHPPERQRRFPASLPPSLTHHRSLSLDETSVSPRNMGAIPKTEPRNRIMVNPMSNEACWKLPNSKTYFCLKSILKQNRRRYTLVTADEFQNLAEQDANRGLGYLDGSGIGEKSYRDIQDDKLVDRSRSRERLNPRRRMPSFEDYISARDKMYVNDQKQESTR